MKKKLTVDDMLQLAFDCGTVSARGNEGNMARKMANAALEIYIGVRSMRACGNARLCDALETARVIAAAPVADFRSAGELGTVIYQVLSVETLLGAGYVGRTARAADQIGRDEDIVNACFVVAKQDWDDVLQTKHAAA